MPRGRPKTRGFDGLLAIDDPSIQDALIEGASRGIGIHRLCKSLGVPESQVRKKRDDDLEFRKRWYAAIVAFERSLVDLQREHAETSPKACQWRLERQFPETWERKRPGVLTPEQVTAVVRRVASLAVEFVPSDKQDAFALSVERIMREAVTMAEQQVDIGMGAES